MNAWSRYLSVSGLLTATSLPVSTLLAPCYGAVAARRFGVAMAGTLVAQQTLVGFALKGRGRGCGAARNGARYYPVSPPEG
ncbi:MAG TPA: hypothetical protein VIO57_16775 [Chloroflexota bacterium]